MKEAGNGDLSPATELRKETLSSPRRSKRFLISPAEPPKLSKIPRSTAESESSDVEEAKTPAVAEAGPEEEEGPEGGEVMAQNPRIQRYLVAVEYMGTRFSGSQQQPNIRTVVGVLEEAFQKFIGQPVAIFCSSRTDAGVHALSNVCHIDVERISKRKPGEVLPPHEPGVVRRAVNHFLQKKEGDIMVTDVRCVPADFHARFKALERTYYYRLLAGPEPLSIFEKDRAWHVPEDLDILTMRKACSILVGCHDFSSFRAAGCQAKSPIKILDELTITEVFPSLYFPTFSERNDTVSPDHTPVCSKMSNWRSSNVSQDSAHSDIPSTIMDGGFGHRSRHNCYVITARARSFLYHQVRLLVGVLKSVGTGELKPNDVERILDAKSITAASPMAPACGLYLGNVKYEFP